MRPLLLEMTGFAAFRERTVVDFENHELLAFTGPTGAGKSSIIDGIAFALFGSVARYGNEKLIAPIINSQSAEARVRLDFSIGDDRYTAVRVIRRTSTGGASTKEARLEKQDANEVIVLAGTAAEVTAEVEDLLGLSFGQFTKTIVLPQGDFARFLTETAGDRQTLLRRLLGLDVYAAMGAQARRRSKEAGIEAEATKQALGTVDIVTNAALARMTKAADKIEAATVAASETHAELLDALQVQAATTEALNQIDQSMGQLEQIEVPEDARAYENDVAAADNAVADAQALHGKAEEQRVAAAEAVNTLTPAGELETSIALHDRSDELVTSCSELDAEVKKATTASAKADEEVTAIEERLTAAREQLESTRIAAGAAGIAATLAIGDDCPVCARVIDELPETHVHDVGRLEDLVSAAEAAAVTSRNAASDAHGQARAAEATAANERQSLAALTEQVAELPTRKQLLALAAKVETATTRLDEAAEAETNATITLAEVMNERAAIGNRAAQLSRNFVEARDGVGALDPPVPSSEDVVENWSELTEWSAAKQKELAAERKELTTKAKADTKALAALEKQLRTTAKPFEIDVDTAPEEVHLALVTQRNEMVATRDEAAFRKKRDADNAARITELEEEALVATELGRLLNAKGFEQWLMSDVMIDLAERATERLHVLSSGAYSLTTDGTDFSVLDHRNADEVRSARTLSGGETFLASLSLALALADSITDMASTAIPPTESVFLDEGFGTLDPETLDVVATAIEELGAAGRLVCIVTHISDLADRLPQHVRVSKGPTGSTITQSPELIEAQG